MLQPLKKGIEIEQKIIDHNFVDLAELYLPVT